MEQNLLVRSDHVYQTLRANRSIACVLLGKVAMYDTYINWLSKAFEAREKAEAEAEATYINDTRKEAK